MQSPRSTRRMIVNADDFGLTAGVNQAIAELRTQGSLTSATLMAAGSAFSHAVGVAKTHPELAVGCHVVLTDGRPVAPADSIPSLLTGDGVLQPSLLRFVLALQTGQIDERHIELEAIAQIRRLQQAGITVHHVDTHKHTHLFPRVARPVMRAAMACGVTAIRNPFEDAWSARLARGPMVRKLEVRLLRTFRSTFEKLLRASGLRTTDGSIGVSATGSLDAASLAALLDAMPPGTWELVCHPGYNDADLDQVRTRLRETRDVERAALLALIPKAVEQGRLELISFRDL